MREIVPGINEQDWAGVEAKLKIVTQFAHVVHIDFSDGKFAPQTSFADPTPFAPYSKDTFFELHMMVENPEQYIEAWAKAGLRRFIGHVEMMENQADFVARAQEWGEVGLALDLHTEVEAITVPLEDLDTVLVMTVKAGSSGQPFNEEPLSKIKQLASHGLFPVEIDGGVREETIRGGVTAGAERFVATSFIFHSENPNKQFETLQLGLMA